jgi:hypothetical protein
VRFQFGVVYHGIAFRFIPNSFQHARGFVRPGRDPNDSLAVIELGIPEALLPRLNQANLFAIVTPRNGTPGEPVVSLLPLANFSGVTMWIENGIAAASNNSGSGATGVTYRPLAGDDRIPSTWSSGEICFQQTAAVGTHGVSIVHEIDASDCQPMDTHCSPSDCAAGVGQALELPDPAALAGG